MALTPTDPTKAQIWIRGTAPDQIIDLYVPRGAKGDPGGYIAGTTLGTNDLNNIKTAGIYRQDDGTKASLLLNYPVVSSGIIHVDERVTGASGSLMQTFYPFLGSSGINPRHFYRRYMVAGSTWGPWEMYASQRIDQSAGRAIYTWDQLNSREQLIYGDTGWRNVTSLAGVAVASGSIFMRRFISSVEIQIDSVTLSGTPNGTLVTAPAGFRSSFMGYFGVIHGPTRGSRSLYVGSNGDMAYNNANAGEVMLNRLTWTTTEAWPTSLPGTAYGSIPNI
ncbi:hypothetical protein SEA_UZUMAKI_20 [Arthrobacter phage Uzumaki]|nr:hypothetical protein SEA_UZUMAKI_20 [Arthrobacter phage Uzumaki]